MVEEAVRNSYPVSAAADSDGCSNKNIRLSRVQFLLAEPLSIPCDRYRNGHMNEQLVLQGIQSELTPLFSAQPLPIQGEVVVVNRLSFEGRIAQAAEAARSAGQAVVYSTDDLLFLDEFARQVAYHEDYPQEPRNFEAGTPFWRKWQNYVEHQRQMLMFCDCVIVTTEYLAERVQELGKPAYVVRNAMSQEMAGLSQSVKRDRTRTGGRVAIGYLSGSSTHNHDFGEVAPVLASLMHRYWNVYLVIVGPMRLPECLQEFGTRIRRHPFVDWQALPELIGDLDINLAPLDMLQTFTHAKSEIKWMEAGAVGVPTIASATAGFCEAVRNGETGLLVNTPQEWETALEELVTHPERRRQIGEAARRDVYERYTSEARSRETLAVFQEIAQRYARTQTPSVPIVLPGLPQLTLPQQRTQYLRRNLMQTARNWKTLANPHFWGRVIHRWEHGQSEGKASQ